MRFCWLVQAIFVEALHGNLVVCHVQVIFSVMSRRSMIFCFIALFLLGVGVFFWRLKVVTNFGDRHVSNFTGAVRLEGCVVDEVDVRRDKVKYTIEARKIELNGERFEVEGKVLVSGGRYPVYEYGDCLSVEGKLEKPGVIEDFSYDKYLARYGVYSVIYRGVLQKIGEEGSLFFKNIYVLKIVLEGRFGRVYREPEASFMAGLLLGSRRGIPDELMTDFNRTGLSHIIAVSGYNITMVIVFIGFLFGFLSRKYRAFCAAVVVLLFVVLVGASAAVVRAGIMGIIGLIALWFGRQYFVGIALFLAAFLMVLWNPLIFLYDVGFQMSFLATVGVVYLAPRMLKYFHRVTGFCGIREALVLTLAAQIMTLPVVLWNFGRFSLIAPVANILVLPLIPPVMIFGFLSIFFGKFVGFFGYLILKLIIALVEFFSSFWFAVWEL